jgi:hypothetical protein
MRPRMARALGGGRGHLQRGPHRWRWRLNGRHRRATKAQSPRQRRSESRRRQRLKRCFSGSAEARGERSAGGGAHGASASGGWHGLRCPWRERGQRLERAAVREREQRLEWADRRWCALEWSRLESRFGKREDREEDKVHGPTRTRVHRTRRRTRESNPPREI